MGWYYQLFCLGLLVLKSGITKKTFQTCNADMFYDMLTLQVFIHLANGLGSSDKVI